MSDKIVGVGIPAIKNKELGKIFDETFNFATNPVGAGDTFSCLLPINSELSEVYYQIGTASTDASADFSAGITGSLTAYASAVSLTPAGPPTLITGATTYLVITFPYALTTGSLRVVVYGRLIG